MGYWQPKTNHQLITGKWHGVTQCPPPPPPPTLWCPVPPHSVRSDLNLYLLKQN